MVDIGVNITRLRDGLGLTRSAFAERIDVPAEKVKSVEMGRQRADHEFLAAVRKAFNVDLNDLICGAGGVIFTSDRENTVSKSHTADQTDFIPIPRFPAEASAGPGALVDGDEQTSGFYAFNRKWLARRGLNPAHLAVISVRGDSMEPRLHGGDLILVDQAQCQIADGIAYVLRVGSDLLVKHVQRIGPETIALISANAFYPAREINLADLGEGEGAIQIIGRVVASMHEW